MEFSDLDLSKIYSYADYLQWDFEERVELIKGKVFPLYTPFTAHQRVSGNIVFALANFLYKKQETVFNAPFDVRFPNLSKENQDIFTVLQPDISVICDRNKIDEPGCLGAPDIVVEILSPGNNKKELQNKYEVYEENGVQEYWIVSPQDKTFFKYILNQDGVYVPSRLLTTGNEVTTPIFPGFIMSLEEVFEDY